ncbi:MAG: GNAT family N-acetyltransferase [Chryseobacterium sp.]|jgi:ribosomal-protein-alanine N-acetyltransferase|uniref:GNAT family N-acetyltransferase n=1 Tax=Chryseobacterium sp. TaxID=1871047 RepID=UPI0028257517|nr:GNAT family N-acetyltransferase [Chryseobacterium sp.]MDR2234760.1 GNAT family N-acetyltransferase [Chryseobacterium sp.]
MMTYPVLETERLILRQLTPEDAEDLFEYFSLDEVMEYYDLAPFKTIEEARNIIKHFNSEFEKGKGFRWALELKSVKKVIGTCGYHNWYKEHFRAEIGYELNPVFWRNSYMKEALLPILTFGFESMELHRVDAFIDPANIASEKLLTSLNFSKEGILKDYFFEKGRFVDATIFGLVNE